MTSLRWRVIVDNDFAGDPDGLVSLAHVLLTDDVRVELITCTPVDPELAHLAGIDASATASLGARGAHALLEVLGSTHHDVVAGAEDFTPGNEPSPAAHAIVDVCHAESDVPLAILCGGPLTNVAAALALEPAIRERATLVWIGGSVHDAPEYNRDTDAAAAASVLASGMSDGAGSARDLRAPARVGRRGQGGIGACVIPRRLARRAPPRPSGIRRRFMALSPWATARLRRSSGSTRIFDRMAAVGLSRTSI